MFYSLVQEIEAERTFTSSTFEHMINTGHPIQVYQLLRRFRRQWLKVKDYVDMSENKERKSKDGN